MPNQSERKGAQTESLAPKGGQRGTRTKVCTYLDLGYLRAPEKAARRPHQESPEAPKEGPEAP